jgi:hypothetical protein
LYVIPFFDILEQIVRVFVEYLADDVAQVACLLNGGTDVLGQAAVFAEVIGRFTITFAPSLILVTLVAPETPCKGIRKGRRARLAR